MSDIDEVTHRLPRRTALQGAAALLAAAATVAGPRPGLAAAAPAGLDGRWTRRIAFVTDSHVDPENDDHQRRLGAAFAAMEVDRPDLVLHGGDITEYGSEAEYRAYVDLLPESLAERIWHVPGNHEIRWDVSAATLYEKYVDRPNLAVELDGVQFLLLDPTVWQQEVGYYTEDDLGWVRRQLRAKRSATPTVIVTHYPMAEGHYYVVNSEDLFEVIDEQNVPLVLAGHTHREFIDRFNGLVQLEGAAVKNAAQYYRMELTGHKGRATSLQIEHIAIPDPQQPLEQEVTPVLELALDDHRRRDAQRRRFEATPGSVGRTGKCRSGPGVGTRCFGRRHRQGRDLSAAALCRSD